MKNKKYGMPPPSSRKEFEHNVNLVLEDAKRAFDSGDEQLIRNKLWATIPHLKRVVYLPNRRIDLSTVNEMLRNQANMMDWMKHMPLPQMKKDDDK
jgi:hypothetical protein